MTNKIVTRESLQAMIDTASPVKIQHIVGRALVGLLARQTAFEQSSEMTKDANGVGFTAFDAEGGTKCAKSYLKNGKLQDWQVEKWTRKAKNGYSRLTKYHKQLNEIAAAKAAQQEAA